MHNPFLFLCASLIVVALVAGCGGGEGETNAPPPPAHNGPAHWIKVTAQRDGTFTVTNTRNGFAKTYAPVAGTN